LRRLLINGASANLLRALVAFERMKRHHLIFGLLRTLVVPVRDGFRKAE